MSEYQYPLEPLFGKLLSPFERFLKQTTSGGIVLIGTTVLTLILASSPWGEAYRHIWETSLHVGVGFYTVKMSVHAWVNEGLMTLFFLLVGLELKREILVGELASLRNAALPVAGALGGMILPALIYFLFNSSGTGAAGWGIPMATDIAFAVGILVLLAWRIPRNLIIFLTALAIADDLGAVLIIALFYTQNINVVLLGIAAGILCILILFNRGGIRHPLPYAVVGFLLWLVLLKSGVHATLAGIMLAFTIPAIPVYTPQQFEEKFHKIEDVFHRELINYDHADILLGNTRMSIIAEKLENALSALQSPQQSMEHSLSPWVTFGIIPLFALANAGLDIGDIPLKQAMTEPVTLGVVLGLVFGKFLGITCFAWITVKLGLSRLPADVGWRHIMGAAWLGGIGFTMSLFIGELAFAGQSSLVENVRVGILTASLIAAIIGLLWLYLSSLAVGTHSRS